MSNNGFLSKRVKLRNQSGITTDRYEFLGLDQAEPNLGDPTVGVSSIGAKPFAGNVSDLYVLVADNTGTGNRYWTNQGNIISGGVISPGSITVRKDGAIIGSVNQITDLNFVGNGITISNPASWVGAGSSSIDLLLQVGISSAAGNYKSIQYAGSNGMLDASGSFIFDPITQRVGINSTLPTQALDIVGNANVSDTIISRNIFTSGVSTANNLRTNTTLYASGISTIVNLTTEYLTVSGISSSNNVYISGILTATSASVGSIDINSISIGSSFGTSDQYLKTTGVGVTWETFPTLRTGISTVATNGQTGFSISYNVGFLDVYVNGIRLNDSDYVAADGTNIILNNPCFGGEVIDILAYSTVSTGSGNGSGGSTVINYYSNWASNVSGIHTLSNVGIKTTNPTSALTVSGDVRVSGVVTATSFVGDGSGLTGVVGSGSGVVVLDSGSTVGTAGTIDFGANLLVSTISAGIVTVTVVGYATEGYVNNSISGLSTFSGDYNDLTNKPFIPSNTGDLTNNVGFITSGALSDYATEGYVNNSIQPSYWVTTTAGIHTLSNVGIGTTNPTSALAVKGNTSLETLNVSGVSTFAGIATVTGPTLFAKQLNVSGVVTATTFYGNVVGSITDATNLTGGYANASQLNVSGVATISQGRIQVDASSNIRFGNLPAGSGSGRNIAIGDQVLYSLSGGLGRNIGIGELSYYDTTTGQYNIGIGERAGQKVTTGAYNVILGAYDGNSGNLDIRTSSNNVVIADGAGNIRQYINASGNVGIKTTVVTEALTVAGVVSATSFYGTLNAGQLTGALPAIDGSALFGVVSTGAGVEIREDETPVGTAGTINFGSNISVSFASGIATVSASIAGINTSGTSTFNQLNSTQLSVSGVSTFAGSNVKINSGNSLDFGTGAGDLHIYRQSGGGSDSIIKYDGSFNFKVLSDITTLASSTGSVTWGVFGNNGVDLYYGNSTKFATLGTGVTVTGTTFTNQLSVSGNTNSAGIITASSFSGSGSGLTNLPAGQLTGTLPAIDGSALLNVNATGSGIVVLDDNVNVGSARSVNFGTGLDVSYSTSGIATITASGGSLQSRTVVTGVTTSIANNGIGNTNITGFKSYALMKVGLSTAGWLRLYTDSASRAADASRSVGIDPSPGSGVIAEVVTTGISTTQIISPFVMGGNLDDTPSTTIYAAITNLSGTTQAITANLTILQLEA